MTSRIIAHVDGDGFFAGCEVSVNRLLRKKPIVVGADRGIALAMTYEAKGLGIKRGMTIREVRAKFPEAIVVPTNFDLYQIYSARMAHIVSRYSAKVETYSIDECFADLSHLHDRKEIERLCRAMKRDLETELGMTFSLGVATTKVLAKIASGWAKPSGFTMILSPRDREEFLGGVPIEDVWGIGRRTTPKFLAMGIRTAKDLRDTNEDIIRARFPKPYQEIQCELRGHSVREVLSATDLPLSLARTRTFTPPSGKKESVSLQLVNNVELAARKLRARDLRAQECVIFLKTQSFRYFWEHIRFPSPLNTPEEIIEEVLPSFHRLWRPGALYRATGITFTHLTLGAGPQASLFSLEGTNTSARSLVYRAVDKINERYGKRVVHIAETTPIFSSREEPESDEEIFMLLGLPHLGEVR